MNCNTCNRKFHVKPSKIKRGGGKYCSPRCFGIGRRGKMAGKNNPNYKEKIKYNCHVCGKEILSRPSHRRSCCSRKCMALYYKTQLKGTDNPHWRGGDVKKVCLFCDKDYIIPRGTRAKIKFCTMKCYVLYVQKFRVNENSPHWKGGVTLKRRYLIRTYWKRIRNKILKRDKYTCRRCNKKTISLHVHHIIPYRINKDDNPQNLITLCQACHAKTEKSGQQYFNFMTHII